MDLLGGGAGEAQTEKRLAAAQKSLFSPGLKLRIDELAQASNARVLRGPLHFRVSFRLSQKIASRRYVRRWSSVEAKLVGLSFSGKCRRNLAAKEGVLQPTPLPTSSCCFQTTLREKDSGAPSLRD